MDRDSGPPSPLGPVLSLICPDQPVSVSDLTQAAFLFARINL